MNLTYTLMINGSEFIGDISVPRDQILKDTLVIIRDGGLASISNWELITAKSLRKGMYLSLGDTYEESGIYNGDIIEIN